MTRPLALVAQAVEGSYAIVRQQLKATQAFVAERHGLREKPLELMDLSWDVRHIILKHLIGSRNIRVFGRSAISIRLPGAARAGNIQLRRECLLVTLNGCTIESHSGPSNAALRAWLSRIDLTGVESSCETGYDAIKSLHFPYFSRFPYHDASITKNNDIVLALACTNLRVLTLNFHPEELRKVSYRHLGAETELAVDCALDIRQSYQLDGLLGATKLEKLQFVSWGSSDNELIGLTEVVAWLDKGFKERGQRVVVRIN